MGMTQTFIFKAYRRLSGFAVSGVKVGTATIAGRDKDLPPMSRFVPVDRDTS